MSNASFRSIIRGKQDKLGEYMDTEHGLLLKLEAKDVITKSHRIDIQVNYVTIGSF